MKKIWKITGEAAKKAACREVLSAPEGHIVTLAEALAEPAMFTASIQQCTLHGERYSFYCKKCKAVRCLTCMKACLGSKHDWEHLAELSRRPGGP